MKTMTLATFNKRAEAEPVCQRLVEAGIAAEIHDHDSSIGRFWFAAEPYATVRLEVAKEDYAKASHLLHLWDTPEGVAHLALHCPECGSSRIEYPQYTRKFFLPNVVGVLSAVGLMEKDFFCMDCHHVWPPPGRKAPRIRHHMAPNYFIEGVEEAVREANRHH